MYGCGGGKRSRLFATAVLLAMTGFAMVMLGGCAGDESEAVGSTTTAASMPDSAATTAPPATPTSSDTTASTATSSEPSGEIGATVSVSSENGAYPKDDVPDWSQIKSVEAYRQASVGVTTIWVSLATYEVTAGDIYEYWDLPYPAAGQGRVELGFTRTLPDVNEPPLVPGTYDLATPEGEAELTGWAKIVVTDGTAVQFDSGSLESDVQVTALSDTEISGTFHVKDNWSEISGTFTAPVK